MINSKKEKGFIAFYLAILILVLMLSIGISIFILIRGEQEILKNITKSNRAYYMAEAGIEDSIYRIIKGKKYEATNQLVVGGGIVNISISSEGDSQVIESVGEISQRLRKLKAVLSTEAISITFHYGAQVDKGGLTIQPNAKVIGNVYSNGSIIGSGSTFSFSEICQSGDACITGDALVAGGVAPEPDQQATTTDSDFPFGLKIDKVYYLDTAQSFVPATSTVLNTVSFYLKKVGSPPDQAVRILSDDAGNPSGPALASGTLRGSKVTVNYSWIDVSFDSPPNLTTGQSYWIMIDVSEDDENYWIWGKDSTDAYPLGTAKYTKDWSKPGDTWSTVGGDLTFKTWMGGDITQIKGTWIGVDAHANSIVDSNITRDAYYQVIDNTSVYGASYPGSSDPPTKDLPISYAQIQEWEKAACCDTGTGCQAECVITPAEGTYFPADGSSLGPVKVEGDLTFPSSGTVTIEGPIWVTGKIYAANNAIIKLKEGLIAGYVLIADDPSDQLNSGRIEFYNNVITQDSAAGGKLLFISTNKSLSVDNPAIWVHNNVNMEDPPGPQSILFGLYGLMKVNNNARFKEITGYAIYLANNAEIVYESGLINTNFSSGPGGGWEIRGWEEIE